MIRYKQTFCCIVKEHARNDVCWELATIGCLQLEGLIIEPSRNRVLCFRHSIVCTGFFSLLVCFLIWHDDLVCFKVRKKKRPFKKGGTTEPSLTQNKTLKNGTTNKQTLSSMTSL